MRPQCPCQRDMRLWRDASQCNYAHGLEQFVAPVHARLSRRVNRSWGPRLIGAFGPSPRRRTIMKRIFSAISTLVILMMYLSAASAQASQETGTGFPISKGSYWVYSGILKGRESQQDCDITKPLE